MLLTAISLIETTLNSHYLKHTKQLYSLLHVSVCDLAWSAGAGLVQETKLLAK